MDVLSFLDGIDTEKELSPENFGENKAQLEKHMLETAREHAKFFAIELSVAGFDPRLIAAFEVDAGAIVAKALREAADEVERGTDQD